MQNGSWKGWLRQLESGDKNVRYEAAKRLSDVESWTVFKRLRDLMVEHPSPDTRLVAGWTLSFHHYRVRRWKGSATAWSSASGWRVS
jgi:hypothetical protein